MGKRACPYCAGFGHWFDDVSRTCLNCKGERAVCNYCLEPTCDCPDDEPTCETCGRYTYACKCKPS